MLEMVEVKEWGGSFQRLEDCDVFGAHLALDLVTDSKLVGAGDVSEWHQDFGVFWSKETLILWLQRPADVVSGTLSKQNEMIWKFQQMRPQKHQDRSETSDTTAELRHTNSTRARTRPTSRIRDKVLHDLPWHGPPTGRKMAPDWHHDIKRPKLRQFAANLLQSFTFTFSLRPHHPRL